MMESVLNTEHLTGQAEALAAELAAVVVVISAEVADTVEEVNRPGGESWAFDRLNVQAKALASVARAGRDLSKVVGNVNQANRDLTEVKRLQARDERDGFRPVNGGPVFTGKLSKGPVDLG